MKTYKTTRLKRGFTLVELLVVIAIIASLAALSAPVIIQQKKKGDMIIATKNVQQLFLLLTDFNEDNNSYPNDRTAQADVELNDYQGDYSNDYLGQLLAAGYIDSEEIFFAKGGSTSGIDANADNVFTTKEQNLAAGENGFAYVKNITSRHGSRAPILMAPMDTSSTFLKEVYGGKGIALRLDGSVQQYKLTKKGQAKIPSSTLFATGEDSVWGDEEPEILLAK